MRTFEELYNRLNTAQKQAVDAIEGPVMVVAGPGTGKTQILTLRIANILRQTDTNPENILALTFTESGVSSMRKRLVEMISTPAYSVCINTFHGFCNGMIEQYPEEFPRVIGSQNITEVDQLRLIEEIIEKTPLKELKPFGDPLHYVKAILISINKLKGEGINPEELADILKKETKEFERIEDLIYETGAHKGKMKGKYQDIEKNLKKNRELRLIYNAYEEELRKRKIYDYADMIMEAMRALKENKNLLLVLQEQYQYILVDEHQDTNNAQNKILELLSSFHPNPNLFVVGDEKQAIYRFQGASLENFYHFKRLYPEAVKITLEENYRSHQLILDAAESVISGEKRLRAKGEHLPKKINIRRFETPDDEIYGLAKDIEEKIKQGARGGEITVLYRENKNASPIARLFEKAGLPFSIESETNLLEDEDVKKLILLFQTVEHIGDDETLAKALHIDVFDIEPIDIWSLLKRAKEEKITIWNIITSEEKLKEMKLESAKNIHALHEKLSRWKKVSKNKNLLDVFEIILRESGLLKHLLSSEDPVEKIEKINSLFSEVRNLVERHRNYSLKDLLLYLESLENNNIHIKKKSLGGKGERVRLMTAHKSKGMEFEYVYMVGVEDGRWGNKRVPSRIHLPDAVYGNMEKKENDKNEDERRLFYVALTRAKKEVTVSYAKTNEEGREQVPSQFIGEIREELKEEESGEAHEQAFKKEKEILFAPKQLKGVDIKDKEFIKEAFMKGGLSVTGLNNYLECPWKYVYVNLLRIPKAKNKHQMYGSAVHGALENFFKKIRYEEPEKDFLLLRFEYHLQKEPLKEQDFEEALKRGKNSLEGYYDAYDGTWIKNTISELNIKGVMLTPEIRLTGKIDKLEIINDKNEVNVVDYKTGDPKTRGEIEGTTKNSEGNIFRQLIFYSLLLNRYADGKYAMARGMIDFVEPDKKGRYKKEEFEIQEKEQKELEETIKRVGEEILEGKCWEKGCEKKECEFCALRK
ncbi:hypothetical protein A3A21_00725 [Candidatus Jorgensenbacteria bacterium RIFCSPLOWO2_01_FULL_45_25b]|uniref:DNA 3'-5' helicase n=1 Tax=Candidatus Jorgensenbacteria bacterium RIFCSPLOWO2_01_FULL_45_25b TaxID=1798471 RepID=A0A1F6BTB8_9BACT|nr:MAG: hypothetical protein A3A21_00725 [Candidatus Jorgensenbacteria bacterium RIFCSPLOWO2_01_FULL_45_25b]